MSNDFASDYVDVAERLREFRDKYPEGSLQQVDVKFIDFASKSWVVYTAAAYRTADDERPAHGTAWEPVPGRTPFTRDSELQNAETSAWGRAIVAIGAADTKRGIATTQDVRNRREEAKAPPSKSRTDQPMTDKTRAQMFALFGERGITDRDEQLRGINVVIEREITSRGDLTEDEAKRVIATLRGAAA